MPAQPREGNIGHRDPRRVDTVKGAAIAYVFGNAVEVLKIIAGGFPDEIMAKIFAESCFGDAVKMDQEEKAR